ncbi:MAG: plasmid stabilization protein [Verrucomicrobia bacterium]|nr:plasmid stabilization protein [Verrucomicrobiota bacterium]
MGYRVTLSATAERDLEQIVRFLALKNVRAAERLGFALIKTSFSLSNFPHRGMMVRVRFRLRRIFRRPCFLIFYRIEGERWLVEIARMWDSRRDPDSLVLS